MGGRGGRMIINCKLLSIAMRKAGEPSLLGVEKFTKESVFSTDGWQLHRRDDGKMGYSKYLSMWKYDIYICIISIR